MKYHIIYFKDPVMDKADFYLVTSEDLEMEKLHYSKTKHKIIHTFDTHNKAATKISELRHIKDLF